MDVYYQVKNRLRAPTLARKLDISRFGLPVVRTDGWLGIWLVDHVINKISRIDRLPNFRRYGLARANVKLRFKLANQLELHTHRLLLNSLKGLLSYRTIRLENCKKKESITVIYKKNNNKITIMNEIKLAISNLVLDWKEVV